MANAAIKLGEHLVPVINAVTTLISVISCIPTPVLMVIGGVVSLIGVLSAIGRAADGVKKGFDVITGVMGGVNSTMARTAMIIMGVVLAISLLATIFAVMSGRGDELTRAFDRANSLAAAANAQVQNPQSIGSPSRYHYAAGTSYHPGGYAKVGEEDSEIINLPTGASVLTAGRTRNRIVNMLSGSAPKQGDIYNVTIQSVNAADIKEMSDFIGILKNSRRVARMG